MEISRFYDTAKDYATIAAEYDNAKAWEEATDNYNHAIEYMVEGIKYDKTASRKFMYAGYINKYRKRMEEIETIINSTVSTERYQYSVPPGSGISLSSSSSSSSSRNGSTNTLKPIITTVVPQSIVLLPVPPLVNDKTNPNVFYDKAKTFADSAVNYDNAGKYNEACTNYILCLEHIVVGVPTDSSNYPMRRSYVQEMGEKYLERIDQLYSLNFLRVDTIVKETIEKLRTQFTVWRKQSMVEHFLNGTSNSTGTNRIPHYYDAPKEDPIILQKIENLRNALQTENTGLIGRTNSNGSTGSTSSRKSTASIGKKNTDLTNKVGISNQRNGISKFTGLNLSALYEKAKENAELAITLDGKAKFREAHSLYIQAVEYLIEGIRQDSMDSRRIQFQEKCHSYMTRIEELNYLLKG